MAVNGFLVDGVIQKYNYESLENYNTPNFSSSSTYEVGDYVMYQGKLYKCITEITTSGGWDSSKWSLAILSDDVANLRSSVESGEYGLSELVKQAILQIARKVAYIDDQGQTYYDDLYDALYPLNVASISAVYTQGGTVYTDDTLNSLKADLVVTAHYSDSSTQTVPDADYTLSGTLTAGTSTITVAYGGKTTTFSVTVTAPLYSIPDFAEQTVSATSGTYRVSKTNGIYTVSGNAVGAGYIHPDGTVSSTKNNTLWFKTIQDKPISSQISEIEWENPNTTAVSLDVKYSQSDATGNLATASFAMSANGSGTDGHAAFENDAYNERNFSGIAFQFSRTSGSGAYANQITASFKIRLFVDGVRYL